MADDHGMADDDAWRVSPKQLLADRKLTARKRFGQNFLLDPRVAQRIAQLLPPATNVIEIGGGTGSLTAALAAQAAALTVLEIDRDLAQLLQQRFQRERDRVHVITSDALQFDFAAELDAQRPPRAIVGNLPYYITTPLLERILGSAQHWELAALMVQREYARRLTAVPGTSDYSSLTLFAGYFCQVHKMFDIGAAGFYPAPKVASTVVTLTPRVADREKVSDEGLLLRVIRAAFAHRRKTLVNSVLAEFPGESRSGRTIVEQALVRADLDRMIRAERLSLADFIRLANALTAAGWAPSAL